MLMISRKQRPRRNLQGQNRPIGHIGPIFVKLLDSYGVFFSVGIRGVSRHDVANPSERAARANPESWCED